MGSSKNTLHERPRLYVPLFRNSFLVTILLLISISVFSQDRKIDSLKAVLESVNDDQAKADIYNQLCLLYARDSPELGLMYCDQAAALSEKINYPVGKAQSIVNTASISFSKGEFAEAEAKYVQAFKEFEAIKNKGGMITCLRAISTVCEELNDDSCSLESLNQSLALNESLNNKDEMADDYIRIALYYKSHSQYDETLENYKKSLDLKTSLEKKTEMAMLYNNIGLIYRKLGDFDKAVEFYLKSLTIKEEMGDDKGARSSLNNIGALYWYLQDYDEALKYYQQCLVISKKLDDEYSSAKDMNNIANVHFKKESYNLALEMYLQSLAKLEKHKAREEVATVLTNIADIYLKRNDNEKALNYYNKSMDIRKELNLGEAVSSSLKDIGGVYLAMGKYEKSIEYSLKSLTIADSIGAKEIQKQDYKNLSDCYQKTGALEDAFKYFKLYSDIKDELDNYESGKKINQLVNEYTKAEEEPASATVSAAGTQRGVKVVQGENNIPVQGEYYALLIGVQDYQVGSGVPDLQFPIADANALAEALLTHYNFKKENVKVITDPTLLQLTGALEELSSKITNADNLLIFYSGHGHWDEKFQRGYWLPSDAMENNRGSWFSNTQLQDYIRAINSKHTLLIADACFSGSLFEMSREAFADASKSTQYKYKLTSRRAMTSGTLETVPDKSVFIKYLLKNLNENEEHYLAAGDLFYKIQNAVSNNSDNLPQYGVIHDTGHEGGDFIFIRK